jgi:dolichyl-phosphate beta-glucosyltransferase
MQQQKDQPILSIVIPAYNEERRIERSLQDLISFFGSFGAGVEILLVIEKSTDTTVEIARHMVGTNPAFKVIANDVQKGKGFAVRTGMLQARGQIVFFMDLDLSTPLAEVLKFLAHFQEHPEIDVLIGSRQHPESQILKRQNPIRNRMGKTFNLFVQWMAIKGITDTQCGFKAFRAKCVAPIFSRQTIDGFSFDVEVLLLAQGLGYQAEAMKLIRKALPQSKGLLGFVGGPLTLFVYAVEGSHQGELTSAREGLTDGRFEGFFERLVDLLAENMAMQARAGADVIAVMDTSAGDFNPRTYQTRVVPFLKILLDRYHAKDTGDRADR